MEPIWDKRKKLIKNPEEVNEIVRKGTEKARKVAQETIKLVRDAMGLY